MKLSQFQFKEFTKYWFDLSKLTIASLVIKFFEPTVSLFSFKSLLTILSGLIFAIVFIIVGLKFSKEVENDTN